ncbi:DUF6783 domain-containing protein [Robinsoniella sp.]
MHTVKCGVQMAGMNFQTNYREGW